MPRVLVVGTLRQLRVSRVLVLGYARAWNLHEARGTGGYIYMYVSMSEGRGGGGPSNGMQGWGERGGGGGSPQTLWGNGRKVGVGGC